MSIGTRSLSDSEVALMLSNLHNYRDKVLFTLGIKTGFRISELLSIKVSDLREHNGTLKDRVIVSRASMKGKHHSRSVPISQTTKQCLEVYISSLPSTQVYLFESQKHGRMNRVTAWRSIKDAAVKSNLTGKIATHSLRKSYSKKIYEASGNDLLRTSKALGHQSIQSTVSYLQFITSTEIDDLILSVEDGE